MTSVPLPPRETIVDALEQLAQHGVPAPGSAHLFDVGTGKFLDYFQREILDDLVVRGGATCKLFEGAYGAGKTHLLQLLHDIGARRGMAVVRTDLSQALNLEDWRLIAQHILQHIQIVAPSGETVESLPRVLEFLGRQERLDTSALKNGTFPHAGFAKAMVLMSEPAKLGGVARERLTRFLLGERVSVADLKAQGVVGVKHPLSARNAELVVKTALAGLFRLGVPGTLLLFDESEQNFEFRSAIPPRRVVLGANLLRRLIDATASGSLVATVAVFAVLPNFVSQCALAYEALGQRLQSRHAARPGWRSPVLGLDAVCGVSAPENFLDELIDRVDVLMRQCDVHLNGKREEMRNVGRLVLSRNAGSGYRRLLVKEIASMTLQQL